jgi:two-component system NtrC family sensor kinase
VTSRLSLGSKIVFILGVTLSVVLGVSTVVSIRAQNDHLISAVQVSAERASSVIKRSLHAGMLANHQGAIEEAITSFGSEPGIDRIRLYDKKGVIRYSTAHAETGDAVDMNADACTMCHGTSSEFTRTSSNQYVRVYSGGAGHRVLGFINPIRNERSCWEADCHAHTRDQTVLGVLDVQLSLAAVDTYVFSSTTSLLVAALITLIIVMGVSAVFVYRSVHLPVQRVIEGTRVLAGGNLAHEIPITSRDELGDLAHSFNAMARDLDAAQRELVRWSETLEEKVEQKTRELRETQAHAVHMEKMASLGKLSSTIAHELNNPLSGILTYAKLVRKRLGAPSIDDTRAEQMARDVSLIADEAKRCGDIVRNLLYFARGQEGEYSATDLVDTIHRCLRLVRHQIDLMGITVDFTHTDAPPHVICDTSQIQQVILALLLNAIEAMPDGGAVSIALSFSPTHAFIRIRDAGSGIDPADLSRIFEPFFTTKERGAGTGLGLSIAYGIVRSHGGTISVQSEVGRGSTFLITLPRVPAPPADETTEPPTQ